MSLATAPPLQLDHYSIQPKMGAQRAQSSLC